jgi:hypothetical protein
MTMVTGPAEAFDLVSDNEACIQLIRNKAAGVGGRTKHIDVQYMFVRDRCMREDLCVVYTYVKKLNSRHRSG